MATSIIKGVIAWQNHKEWEIVFKELYSGDRKLQQHAVDIMGVWWTRFGDRLSTGIINSYELMKSLLAVDDDGDCEIHRQNVAMSIVRFVNFTTDKKQTNAHARSTLGIAKSMEMPEWLVEMRHGVTHQGGLPSLSMLVHGAKIALEWLKTNYWEAQNEGRAGDNASQKKKSKQVNSLENILIQYMKEQFHVTHGDQEDSNENISLILDDFCGLASDQDSLGLLDVAMGLLCNEGYLIPTDEQLESLGIMHSELLHGKNCDIPKQLILLWQPLLNSVNRMGFCVNLLEHLADLDPSEGVMERLVMGWINHILNTYGETEDIPGEKMKLNVHDVILKLLDKPKKYTSRILDVAFGLEHHFTAQQQEELTKMIRIVNCEDLPKVNGQKNSNRIYRAKDFLVNSLHKQKAEVIEESDDMQIEDESEAHRDRKRVCKGWQLADKSIPWGRYPIGTCPAYIDGNTATLELYDVYPSLDAQSDKKGIQFEDELNTEQEESESQMDVDMDMESEALEKNLDTEEELENEPVAKSRKWTDKEMHKLKSGLVVL